MGEVLLKSVPILVYHPRDGLIPAAPKTSTQAVKQWLKNSEVYFSEFREFSPALHKLCFLNRRTKHIAVRLLQRDEDLLFANLYLNTAKLHVPAPIIPKHPNHRFVLQHLNPTPVPFRLVIKNRNTIPTLRPVKRARVMKGRPSPCGFVDCDGSCEPVAKEKRTQFSMDNLLDECALKGVRASQAAVEENSERNSNLQYRLGPNDLLSRMPFEVMREIAKFCGTADLRALGRTNRLNNSVLRHFIPALKLTLYPHQCAALDRMIEMEQCRKRKPLPLLELVKDVNGIFITADLVDGAMYALANMPRADPPPRGGFLCDEPGLGKTITGIALILKTLDVRTLPPPGVTALPNPLPHDGGMHTFYQYFEDAMPDIQAASEAGSKMGPKRSTRILSEIMSDDEATRARAMQLAVDSEKTISLRSSRVQTEVEPVSIYLSSATIIFAPRELIPHWEEQILLHTKPGAIRLCTIIEKKRFPSAESLAADFDVILVSFNKLSSMYYCVQEKGEKDHPMVSVRFLRVIFDEGHKLGSGTKFHNACLSVKAERRWIMTGTPMRNTPTSDCEQLHSTLRFLRESNFGLDHDTWTNAIRKPFGEFRASGLAAFKNLLHSIMIRTNKKSIADIPGVKIKTIRLGFSDDSAKSYNALYRLITRNLITSDWFSDNHKQSMLNAEHSGLLTQVIMNLRRACNTGLKFNMQVNHKDLMSSLENMFHFATSKKHGRLGEIRPIDRVALLYNESNERQPVTLTSIRSHLKMDDIPCIEPRICGTKEQVEGLDEKVVQLRFLSETNKDWTVCVEYRGVLGEIASFFLKGGSCNKCNEFAKEPFLAPCAHVLCSECMMTDRKCCPVCSGSYGLDSYGVPEQMIELQPSIVNFDEKWDSDMSAVKNSVKMKYLLGILKKLHKWNADHPTEQPKKAILFSGFTENLFCASIALKEDPVLKNCYAEMYTNTTDFNLKGVNVHAHFDRELDRFRSVRECSVLLLEKRRGSVGLDLSFVEHVFLMEPVWDASLEKQVIARAHRLGARNTVYVERLVVKGSVEEDILASCKMVGNDRKTKKGLEENRKRNIILNLKTVQYSPVTPSNGGADDLVIDSLEENEPMPRDNGETPLRKAYSERVSTTSPGETKSKKKQKRKSGDHLADLWGKTRKKLKF